MKLKSDCTVSYKPGPEPLEIRLESSVGVLFGRAMEKTARETAIVCGVSTGTMTIQDDGAIDCVVAARVEATLRAAGHARALATGQVVACQVVTCQVPSGGATTASGSASSEPLDLDARRKRLRRSRLYLPGNQPDLLPNAGLFGADCLVLDLEDSVAPARKIEARILARRILEAHRDFFAGSELAVRINPLAGDWGRDDLAELAHCLPDAVLLPKCESADQIAELATELDRLEAESGQEPGSTFILALLESARGILAAPSIAAASPRLTALCFGAEDFSRDIGASRSSGGTEAAYAQQAIVLAAKAAGVQAQDSVFSDTEDEAGLAAYCRNSSALGFDGIGLIHPRQIPVAHQGFAPSPEEMDEAVHIIEALEQAEAEGLGVASLGGKMIDAPVAERARGLLMRSVSKPAGKVG
ncbi:MAG: aldolase/citrate lyase family protein [Spirochaetota bacterium]